MKIVNAATLEADASPLPHRHGGVELGYLFQGDEHSPDNFLWAMARETPEYYSPRHRHNFDQVRFCLEGSVPIGRHLTVGAGEVGYFPEGVPYGPQQGGVPRRVLVLQFGGASGQGYMSPRQLRQGYEALLNEGHFEKGVFHRDCGEGRRTQDSYDAIWQKVFGRPVDYPPARYKAPLVMKPESFPWIPVENAPGVRRRVLGSFGERAMRLEFYAVDTGAAWTMPGQAARRLLFLWHGTGTCDGQSCRAETAIQLEPAQSLEISAPANMEFFLITLPMLRPGHLRD